MLRGLPHNVTTEMDLALWQLAGRMRADAAAARALRGTPPAELAARYRAGALPPDAAAGLAAFLRRYGHRAVAEIDLGMPRWSDDPDHVLGVARQLPAPRRPRRARRTPCSPAAPRRPRR